MFSSYKVEASSLYSDQQVSQYSDGGFGGVTNPGPGRTSSGFSDAFSSVVNGEVETGLSFSGEPGHNSSLSSQNHSIACNVILDTAQKSQMETMIPRGKIGFFVMGGESLSSRLATSVPRRQMPSVSVIFGGTKMKDNTPPAAYFSAPVVSTVFVPGHASHLTSKSQFITFAFGDSTVVELESAKGVSLNADKKHCVNPDVDSTMMTVPPGAPIFCAPRLDGQRKLVACLFCGTPPHDASLLGILKLPLSHGDTQATVALIR